MPTKAQRSVGTRLGIGTTATIFVAGLTSISGLEQTAEEIDVTTLDSDGGYREFIGGFKDGGSVALEGFFYTDEGDGQAEMYARFQSGETDTYLIVFPPEMEAVWKFDGVVTGFNTSAEMEGAVAFSGTIRVSGKPELLLGNSSLPFYPAAAAAAAIEPMKASSKAQTATNKEV